MVGQTLGHYEILELLGKGGMGEVYRARDKVLDRHVAIKVLPESFRQDSERMARFVREAQAVARLDHPNILAIHDFGSERNVAYAVTELLEGSNLRERLPTKGMEWQKATEIGAAVAEGLAAAHAKRIVHRDLKPENIFITRDGRTKVLDFGLAQVREAADENDETVTLTPAGTVPGTVMGTVGYMSPEQVKGEPADGRTDIFAFGCVLYEMLTGQRAFVRNSTAETQAAILKEDPPSLSAVGIPVPPELERTLRRCLEKTPEARFQSASDLAYNLRSIATDQAIRLPAPSEGTPNSIAILPLRNLTGDREQAYFVDGLHEELISTFARISAFDKVIARTSVLGFRESATPIRQIGEQLGVGLVMEGSVRRGGDTVRTTLQLIDANTENHLWANSFESDLTDILALQSDVARAVVEEIKLALTPEEEARLAATRTVNPLAHEAYMIGFFQTQRLTVESFDTAERYFNLALERDPSFAPAHEGLAFVWSARSQMGVTPPHEAVPRVKAAAKRALALDPGSASAHETLAVIRTWIDWDWAAAELEWERAVELNPNAANTHAYYAQYLAILGRLDEALRHGERALELDPVNSLYHAMHASTLCFARRFEESLAAANAGLAIQPDHPVALFSAIIAATQVGRHSEALTAVKRYLKVNYAEPADDEVLERAWAEDGITGAIRQMASIMASRFSSGHTLPADTAGFYAMVLEHDEALEWLERALEFRDQNMPYIGLPIYDSVRSDVRFLAIVDKMGFPEDWAGRASRKSAG